MARSYAKRVPINLTQSPLVAAGTARPSSPISVFAEDFSLLIRTPRRMRIARSKIRVLS